MKKIFIGLFILLCGFVLASCGNDGGKTETPKVEYNKKVNPTLEEGSDYISHANTYNGKTFEYNEQMWYYNNLDKVPLPDPQIYEEDGVFYIVGTCDANVHVVMCYTTTDFNTFEKAGIIYNPATYKGWESSQPTIYAPEMYCFDGVYYLYYSALDKDGYRRNSVVQASSPLGPYEPIVNDTVDGLHNPVFVDSNEKSHVLDSTIFVDDDGQMYMYYSVASGGGQHLVGVKMDNPYTADWSTYVDLVRPGCTDSNFTNTSLRWELYHKICEAPYMIKSNGKYYLTYSANGCWDKYYNVCYAVSDSPLGNFVKPYHPGKTWTNLLLGFPGDSNTGSKVYKQWSGFASGTGHHAFFNIGGQTMIVYHAHQNRDWNKGTFTQRYVAIDYLFFDEEGVPYCNGPTWSIQPLPEGISGYKNIALDATIRVENVENIEYVNDNYIEDTYNLIEGEALEVKLGEGYSFIEFEFDKEYEIGGIAIYNSVYYANMVEEAHYIDLGNGNALIYPQFCLETYTNEELEFVHPSSAITVEFVKSIKTNRIIIAFNLPEDGSINDIKILGK